MRLAVLTAALSPREFLVLLLLKMLHWSLKHVSSFVVWIETILEFVHQKFHRIKNSELSTNKHNFANDTRCLERCKLLFKTKMNSKISIFIHTKIKIHIKVSRWQLILWYLHNMIEHQNEEEHLVWNTLTVLIKKLYKKRGIYEVVLLYKKIINCKTCKIGLILVMDVDEKFIYFSWFDMALNFCKYWLYKLKLYLQKKFKNVYWIQIKQTLSNEC